MNGRLSTSLPASWYDEKQLQKIEVIKMAKDDDMMIYCPLLKKKFMMAIAMKSSIVDMEN